MLPRTALTNNTIYMKTIKQSVLNTFKRVGIDPARFNADDLKSSIAINRFSGERVHVTPLIEYLIVWVYKTSDDYERGIHDVRVDDFDRIRYFILREDKDAYMACID